MSNSNHNRRYFLNDVPLQEALKSFELALGESNLLGLMKSELIKIDDSCGMVTSEPVWANVSSPHYDSAAMDGISVRAKDTIGATETSPKKLFIGSDAEWIDTGDPLPDGFDAVVMIEVVNRLSDNCVEIRSPVHPYSNIRPIGEDVISGELLLPENHVLRPIDLGACAASGVTEILVRSPVKVAIIPTGTELVPIGSDTNPGDIIEYNSLVISELIKEWGGNPTRFNPVADDYELIKQKILEASDHYDLILVNAGSSAGSEDYTADIVESLGDLVVHGVALRPGHPVVLGIVSETPLIGIPGYPVSAVVTSELFVKPLIESKLGIETSERERIDAKITTKVNSPMGEDEFLRVRLGLVGNSMLAMPIQRGAGVITSLVEADGFVKIPSFSEGVDQGQKVQVELLKRINVINRTIVCTGSHDLTLDLLASRLSSLSPARFLASSNVGSLGGLLALNRGQSHFAGTHLLDESSGEYNLSYVKKYVKNRSLVIVNFLNRDQGLIVPYGNPEYLHSIDDLSQRGIVFVNRQKGSGTRALLDYQLKLSGIDFKSISGYETEEYTHLAVAASVFSNKSNTGLGIQSAAVAMGLDFIPLFTEQYDLVIPEEFYDGEIFKPVLEVINNQKFKEDVEDLGGYDTSMMGHEVIRIKT